MTRKKQELNYASGSNEEVSLKIRQCIVVGHYIAGVAAS